MASRGTRQPMKCAGVGRTMLNPARLRVAKNASPSRSISSRSRCCAKLHPRTLTQNKRSFSPCPAAPLGRAAWRRPENVPRHEGESRQRPLDHIDVWRAIRKRLQRVERLEPRRQNHALARVEIPDHGCRSHLFIRHFHRVPIS